MLHHRVLRERDDTTTLGQKKKGPPDKKKLRRTIRKGSKSANETDQSAPKTDTGVLKTDSSVKITGTLKACSDSTLNIHYPIPTKLREPREESSTDTPSEESENTMPGTRNKNDKSVSRAVYDKCVKKTKDQNAKILELEETIACNEQQMESKGRELQSMTGEVEKLKTQVETSKKLIATVEQKELCEATIVSHIKLDINELVDSQARFEHECKLLNKCNKEFKKTMEETSKTNVRLDKRVKSLEKSLKNANESLKTASENLNRLREDASKEAASAWKVNQNLKDQLMQLKKSATTDLSTVPNTVSPDKKTEKKIKQLEQDLEFARKSHQTLTNQIKKVEGDLEFAQGWMQMQKGMEMWYTANDMDDLCRQLGEAQLCTDQGLKDSAKRDREYAKEAKKKVTDLQAKRR